NTPAACVGSPFDGDHNMGTDNCGLSSTANPLLGPLASNGGPTDTRALSSSSPAINAGSGCPATDQRGAARVSTCDIGAYEYRPPRLTVIKKVVNDDGGTATPADFGVHVLLGGNEVAGSPQPGSATGTTYALSPGTYAVGEFTDSRYVGSFSGDCAANGAITLAEGQVKTCTITNNDKPPVVGKIVNAEPEGGTVTFKLPNGKKFRKLTEGQQLPVGTIIDTRKGRIGLTAAANKT